MDEREINRKLNYLRQLRRQSLKELEGCRKGFMIRNSTKTSAFNYVEVFKVGNDHTRRGITRNRDAIYSHARKRYLLRLTKILETNIKALEHLQQSYESMEFDEIIKSLPMAYDDLPVEAFFSDHNQSDWEAESYPHNPHFPENLRHVTLRGHKVRSKSELYIASQLDQHGIAYRYEMEIRLGNKLYYPDFILYNPRNGALTYWEHCGLVNDENYMLSHYEKVITYAKYGIAPWKNLIITYDDENGNINALDIDHTIRGWLSKIDRER